MGRSDRVLTCKRNLSSIALIAVPLVIACGVARVQAQTAPTATAAPTPNQRLASEIMRAALSSAATTPLTSEALDIACMLATEAVGLDPDSAGLWRLALNLATLAERDDLRTQALERLSALDPANESVRMQRLEMAIDRYPTVEVRAEAYEKLLSDDNIERLGPAGASRIALDLALLKQRLGDTDAFSRWLTKALELDRSNRSAAALAAGFFQANVNDPVGRAELLTNLVLADPTNVQTQVTLAQHLLENGAYAAASRMYQIVGNGLKAAHMQTTSELMADVAIAQWAAGDIEGSLTTIDRRQSDIDEAFRAEKARTDRNLTMVEVGKLKGPVDSTLAAVAAVIHAGLRDAQAQATLDAAIAAAEAEITSATAAKPPLEPADLASRHLQIAWTALWLGGDAAKAAEHVAEAEKLQPLSDQANKRFEGWQAFKKGETDRAIELLSPLAANDSAARVGLALALKSAGSKDAARELLELNKSQPGSLIGIWAANELTAILGQRLPLSKQAVDLEHLIASISQSFDRYPRDPSMVIDLRATLANPNPGPFDPIIVTVQLTNNTFLPLAIDRDGPLRPQVLVGPTINTAVPLRSQPKPFVIDLDSRLRLMPRETVSLTFDLRWYGATDVLNIVASAGGIVKLLIDSNFVAVGEGILMPGLYGVEQQAPLLRIDGVRKNENWLQLAIASLTDPAVSPDTLMVNIALLGNELVLLESTAALPKEAHEALKEAKTALPEAYGRLDPVRQAWLLAVMSERTPVGPIYDMARKSDSRLVRMAYMLYHLGGPGDPMLDAARRGDDPALKHLADRLAQRAAALVGSAATSAPAKAPTTTTAPTSTPASAPTPG